MSFPPPQNPVITSDADVYAAVREYIRTYAPPALASEDIHCGWHEHAASSSNSRDFAVITVQAHERHGSSVETFHAPDPDADGTLEVKNLISCHVRIDFCSDEDHARQRTQALETISRSSVGVCFFNSYGMSCLYSEDVTASSSDEESSLSFFKYSTVLHLSYWSAISLEAPWFDNVAIRRIENVGVHHPLTE